MTHSEFNKEPKKEKNAKHGLIAIGALVVMAIFIVIGIISYGNRNTSTEPVKPVDNTETSSVNQPSN